MTEQHYHWRILQQGALPLCPDGARDFSVEHRCTITLIWPEGEAPMTANTVMVDPCFTDAGYWTAAAALDTVGAAITNVGRVFTTHLHGDHMLHLPYSVRAPRFRSLRPDIAANDPLAGLCFEQCPGHHPLLLVPTFTDGNGRAVWVASDAILNEDWLRAWQFYYPNGYSADDVIVTWRSLARILRAADIVIPGHGPAFAVTVDLVAALLDAFPTAPYADHCPDVADVLRARLRTFSDG